MNLRSFPLVVFGLIFSCLSFFFLVRPASAVSCVISSATVVNQAYVTSNSCTSIEIQGNVSTTWIGTVDLGGGVVTVKTGFTMMMGSSSQMVLGAADDFVIESGATTTHYAEDPSGVDISARNITVTGKLDVSSKGCAGTGSTDGRGPNLTTYICASATSGGGGQAAGGSYGGQGAAGFGAARSVYGIATSTLYLGSGGGGPAFSGTRGGNGGGRVRLVASGTLTIDGSVLAKGEGGVVANTGGGSGGSIYLSAPVLAGSGQIDATGGAGAGFGGYGGGGRIAVYYDSTTFSDLSGVVARAGSGVDATGNGTVFILDRTTDDGAGNVRINSGFDFPAGFDATRDTFTAASGTRLGCAAQTTIAIGGTSAVLDGTYWTCSAAVTNVTITGSSTLTASSTVWSLTNVTNFSVYASSTFDVTASAWTISKQGAIITILTPATLALDRFTLVGASDAGSSSADGGRLFLTPDLTLSLVSSTLSVSTVSSTFSTLSIDSLSSIDVSGRGCAGTAANTGYGPHTTTGICGSGLAGAGNQAAGAGHGGAGGAGYSSAGGTYGSSTQPVLFGSGGGGPAFVGTRGGSGGGVIRLTVSGTLTLDGKLWSNGEGGVTGYTGGGSGGSVYVYTRSVEGSGTVQAKGGASGPTNGGGGGGGRVFIAYGQLVTFSTSGNVSVTGGTGVGNSGSDGTTSYLLLNQAPDLPASLAPAALVDGSTTSTDTPTFSFSITDPDVTDTVKYRIQIDDSSDFASPLIDYTSDFVAQGTLGFQVGQAAGTGAYNITSSSTLPNGSYYWQVKAIDQNSVESSYVPANGGSVAFVVDATPRFLSFESASYSDLESVTATSIKILLDQTHFEDVSVNYSIISASTTADGSGEDYTLASGTATISAGQTSTTISLLIVDDEIDEPNEEIAIELSSPLYAVIGSNTSTVYTIVDDDTAGVMVTESSGSTAVTEGGATDSFTVVLTSLPTSTVQILFTTSTNGLTLSTSTLTFTSSDWSVAQTVTVTATDDDVYESTHTTSVEPIVSASAYGYDVLTVSSFAVTITDNEASDITLSASSLSVTEGASNTYTIVLASAPTSTVEIVLSAGTGLQLSSSTLTFTSGNYATPQTVTVTPVNDLVYTGNRMVSISQTVSSTGSFASVVLPSISVSIFEDDIQGGGGFAGSAGVGGAIGSTIPTWLNTPPPPPPSPPPTTPPVIVVVPPRSPDIPATPLPPEVTPSPNGSQVVTILNPGDVLSLVEATNGGRDFAQEAKQQSLLRQDSREFRVAMSDEESLVLANFVTYGISSRTRALGTGERRALVRDAMQTMGTADISPADFERLVRGIIPQMRNLTIERQQLPRVRQTFRTIYGHDPNFQDPEENLAWNTLMYRIRFERDLNAERQGIEEFRRLFRRDPRDPFQWSVVRVLGYVRS